MVGVCVPRTEQRSNLFVRKIPDARTATLLKEKEKVRDCWHCVWVTFKDAVAFP